MYSLTIELRKFVAAFHSSTAFHPFLGRRQDTLGFPSVSKGNPVVFWCFWLLVRPLFLCCFAVFPAGETQIWPEDLRIVAVLLVFVWFLICLCGTKVFHNVCNLFLLSLLGPSLRAKSAQQKKVLREVMHAGVATQRRATQRRS